MFAEFAVFPVFAMLAMFAVFALFAMFAVFGVFAVFAVFALCEVCGTETFGDTLCHATRPIRFSTVGQLVPAVLVNVCISLTPRSMTVVFGLGTRQCVRMHTRLENGILRNKQYSLRVL